ncbi:MAG: sulfurtransferase [Verrucomicrobiae bacterium]|nr:sulfurtransferase [Verrucomicrobiae bacterium]
MKHTPEFEKICEDSRKRVREISVEEAAKLAQSGQAILVDVREDHEWNEAHAAGAIHLGRGIIERDIHNVAKAKDQSLLLYCGGGYRSALAADNLGKMGYTQVRSVAGGWKAWVASGLPTERSR